MTVRDLHRTAARIALGLTPVLVVLTAGQGCSRALPPSALKTAGPTSGPYDDSTMDAIRVKFLVDPLDGLLNVVPAGAAMPQAQIFKKLGLDPKRLAKPKAAQFDRVVYRTWKVSPSFESTMMMDVMNAPDGNAYGVRLRKRVTVQR